LFSIYALDLLGTFAFAVFGANIAIRKKLDLFGVLTCAVLTALGGGTIRSLLLGEVPFYFINNTYIVVLFAIATYKFFEKIERVMLLVDAVGLSTFAFIGAAAAASAGFGTFAIALLAVINAVGGSIIRDAVIHELPSVFHEGLYATPALVLGLLYGIFSGLQQNMAFVLFLLGLSFAMRLASIYKEVRVWRPSDQVEMLPEAE
jgi:uncharacterized membrane protein YeiH